jgi:hypothetical protein
LEREWLALGFRPGVPFLPSALVEADKRIYRGMRCGECGHRGQRVTAYHRGKVWRLLCECRHCWAGAEA